jgi:hypothetical protein
MNLASKVTMTRETPTLGEDALFSAGDVPLVASRARRVLAAMEGSIRLPALVGRDLLPRAVSLSVAHREVSAALARCGALTVDVETTGYPVGHRNYQLRTVQLGDARTAVVFDATDPEHAEVIRTLLATAPRLHAHSATADLVPLAHAGLVDADSAWERMGDTVISAKLSDPASTGSDPGLKKLAAAVLSIQALTPQAEAARVQLFARGGWLTDTEATTPLTRSGWAQVDPTWPTMIRYATADVLDTAALAKRLPRMSPTVLDRERAAQHLCARITHLGLPLDGTHITSLLRTHTVERGAAVDRARARRITNPGSDPQVGAALMAAGAELPRTKTGAPSVAVGALAPLRETPGAVGELVSAVLDYRHHDTLITTFLEPYQALVEHGDGRVRPTIYTLGTDTGRMSCVRPNLQQQPRTGGIRACITADPGHMLISADFSGVELRVAAALSGDTELARIITEDDTAKARDPAAKTDIHWRIAREVYGPGATKLDRSNTKRGVFGRLYGAGIPGIARTLRIREAEAAAVVETLDAMTPGLAAWSKRFRKAVEAGNTQFTTYSGRVIYLPEGSPHASVNYAIQGTARELLVDALLRWRDTPWGTSVLLPVHDEIIVMVPTSDATAATATLVECMHTEFQRIPIIAEADEPTHAWADAA